MIDFKESQPINGTYGDVWIDSDYMAEVISVEAKITFEKTEVNKARRLTKGYKVIGIEGKGTLKMYKVSSSMIKRLSEDMKQGIQTPCTIITNLNDPASLGCERIRLNNCTFDELTLANWERRKVGEESIPFTFTDWELLDLIED